MINLVSSLDPCRPQTQNWGVLVIRAQSSSAKEQLCTGIWTGYQGCIYSWSTDRKTIAEKTTPDRFVHLTSLNAWCSRSLGNVLFILTPLRTVSRNYNECLSCYEQLFMAPSLLSICGQALHGIMASRMFQKLHGDIEEHHDRHTHVVNWGDDFARMDDEKRKTDFPYPRLKSNIFCIF